MLARFKNKFSTLLHPPSPPLLISKEKSIFFNFFLQVYLLWLLAKSTNIPFQKTLALKFKSPIFEIVTMAFFFNLNRSI